LKSTFPLGVPAPGAVTVTVAVNVTDCPTVEGLGLEPNAVDVLALFTVCASPLEVLTLKFPSPPYSAVIVCDPTDKLLVVRVASPVPSSVSVPNVVTPSLNVTVPLGVPAPGALAVIVAVKVTDSPNFDGFTSATTAALLSALPTT